MLKRKPSICVNNDKYTQLPKINDVTVLYNGAVAEYEDAADYYRPGSVKVVKVG